MTAPTVVPFTKSELVTLQNKDGKEVKVSSLMFQISLLKVLKKTGLKLEISAKAPLIQSQTKT